MDGLGQLFLVLGVERRPARRDLAAGVLLEHLGDEGPRELTLVLTRHRRDTGRGVQTALLGEPVSNVPAEPLDDAMVHRSSPPPRLAGPGLAGLGGLGGRRRGGAA